MSSNVRAIGRAAARIWRSHGNTFSSHQRGDVGERQQPQRLAGRRAVDDDRVALAGLVVALELQQREQLVHAGRHGQLLGRDPVDAALGEQLAEPLLHRRPVALHLLLGLDLLGPQAVGRPASARRRQLGLERVGEAVRRVGREHERARAAPRRSGARWRRRPTSCRRRPCPCRGSSAGPSPPRVYETWSVPTMRPKFPATSVAARRTVSVPRRAGARGS